MQDAALAARVGANADEQAWKKFMETRNAARPGATDQVWARERGTRKVDTGAIKALAKKRRAKRKAQ